MYSSNHGAQLKSSSFKDYALELDTSEAGKTYILKYLTDDDEIEFKRQCLWVLFNNSMIDLMREELPIHLMDTSDNVAYIHENSPPLDYKAEKAIRMRCFSLMGSWFQKKYEENHPLFVEVLNTLIDLNRRRLRYADGVTALEYFRVLPNDVKIKTLVLEYMDLPTNYGGGISYKMYAQARSVTTTYYFRLFWHEYKTEFNSFHSKISEGFEISTSLPGYCKYCGIRKAPPNQPCKICKSKRSCDYPSNMWNHTAGLCHCNAYHSKGHCDFCDMTHLPRDPVKPIHDAKFMVNCPFCNRWYKDERYGTSDSRVFKINGKDRRVYFCDKICASGFRFKTEKSVAHNEWGWKIEFYD